MFEHLSAYPRIVVTGPQRAGTTITTHMIAADTGHRVIDEIDYGVYDVERWHACLDDERVVVQSPTMLRRIVDERDPSVLAVLVRRPLAEIHASRDRIDWWIHEPTMLTIFDAVEGDSAALAYAYWDDHAPMAVWMEVDYHTLAAHPLWVPPEGRVGFAAKQIA